MSVKAQEKMQVKGVKKNNNTSLLKRITCLALASLSLTSLSACDYKNNTPTDIPTTSVEIPAEIPELTEITIETPEPTPTPIEFSYENVFSEIFSDEALAELYPDIKDYARERERIYSNISRIEDFEFYELTEEEQAFIKEAQLGNIDASQESELREVLTKILIKDPYVFDDVDNEVKLNNRANKFSTYYKNTYFDQTGLEFYDSEKFFTKVRNNLRGNNCGRMDIINPDTAAFSIGLNVSKNYFLEEILPEYKSGNWRGNYYTFDFYQYLLDGSEGQKLAKKLYDANVKLFNSPKEEIDENLKEFVDLSLQILFINDVLGNPDGIKSLSSKSHQAVIYCYSFYYVIWTLPENMASNYKYIVPKEYADAIGLSKTKLSYGDVYSLADKYVNLNDMIGNGLEELKAAQSKYQKEQKLILTNN